MLSWAQSIIFWLFCLLQWFSCSLSLLFNYFTDERYSTNINLFNLGAGNIPNLVVWKMCAFDGHCVDNTQILREMSEFWSKFASELWLYRFEWAFWNCRQLNRVAYRALQVRGLRSRCNALSTTKLAAMHVRPAPQIFTWIHCRTNEVRIIKSVAIFTIKFV